MTHDSGPLDFFRCPVQADQANATLRSGLRKIPVVVRETSIDGFTVLIGKKYAPRLKVGRPWTLRMSGEHAVVRGEWMFNTPDGVLQVGLRRMGDATPVKSSDSSWSSLLWSPRRFLRSHSNPEVVFGGLLLSLFVLLSTPPVGVALGTASRIRGVASYLIGELRSLM